jgi:excisionase family DNA binding protein
MPAETNHASSVTLLTIPQVMERLHICRSHVYTLIHRGLPVVRLGRAVRINVTSLEQWLAAQEQPEAFDEFSLGELVRTRSAHKPSRVAQHRGNTRSVSSIEE